MTATDLQRWSRDVAEDPGSASFVPLARAYRRQGRRDAAMSVVLQGLERNPEHLDGHALLALLHVEAGDRQKAGDEWETILRLEPTNFDARRGLGFLALENGDLDRASEHLRAAEAARPGDSTIQQALEVLARREQARNADNSGNAEAGRPGAAAAPPNGSTGRDPTRLFEPLTRETPFLGALLLDDRGRVLAGDVSRDGGRDGEALGALLSPAVSEAARAARLLGMGGWDGLLLECEGAVLHVTPSPEGTVVIAARSGAPAGWVARTAHRASELARQFLEASR